MAFSTWLAFLLASILIAVSPGPGAATSMSLGLRHGYRAALRAIGGLQSALIIQLAIVFAGLGALLMTSATAFNIMKFLGAAYLIWLGIQKWRDAPQTIEEGVNIRSGSLFAQGLLVNLTNPKAIVFMAALTPQFIDPARPQWLQFIILASTMCGVDTVVMSGYALLATRLRRWLRDPRAMTAQNRFFGGIFVGAGVLLAVSGRN
ncbi:homoserine/homoserine lactone efflux protein [Betaproteobacteria bacterium]|nr:homoserine/homoserine lactone efflux protein [Betaproteobacteria bacterium]